MSSKRVSRYRLNPSALEKRNYENDKITDTYFDPNIDYHKTITFGKLIYSEPVGPQRSPSNRNNIVNRSMLGDKETLDQGRKLAVVKKK